MRRLFQIARDALQQSIERKTSTKHYEQILSTEVICGMQKLQLVKRRFEEADGLQEPTDQGNLATSADEERYQNTMEFDKNTRQRRKQMNWRDCHN
ncbi:unnamed protein product [Rhizopus stolonifer]